MLEDVESKIRRRRQLVALTLRRDSRQHFACSIGDRRTTRVAIEHAQAVVHAEGEAIDAARHEHGNELARRSESVRRP